MILSMNQGIDLIRRMAAARGPIFGVQEARPAAGEMGLSDAQLRWTLSDLARQGWLVRLKRGVYAMRPPLNGADLHPFAVADALVQPAAISHWSALAHHGLTTQIPPMVQASTTRTVVTPEMRAGRAHRPRGHAVWSVLDWEFEFIKVRPKSWFGFQHEWVTQWHRVAITDAERTVLDMFAHPGVFGSIRVGMETLEGAAGSLDLERLVRYALRYDVGAVIKRLGWTLERMGTAGSLLEPLVERRVRHTVRLDPAGPAGGASDPRWSVVDNLRPVEGV